MASFEVLMLQPGMPQMTERLEPRVALRKLYEAADREGADTSAAIAPNIRAVISTVDAPVDAALMRRLPKLEIVVGLRRRLRSHRRRLGRPAWHRRYPHARRARRRRRRHSPSP